MAHIVAAVHEVHHQIGILGIKHIGAWIGEVDAVGGSVSELVGIGCGDADGKGHLRVLQRVGIRRCEGEPAGGVFIGNGAVGRDNRRRIEGGGGLDQVHIAAGRGAERCHHGGAEGEHVCKRAVGKIRRAVKRLEVLYAEAEGHLVAGRIFLAVERHAAFRRVLQLIFLPVDVEVRCGFDGISILVEFLYALGPHGKGGDIFGIAQEII